MNRSDHSRPVRGSGPAVDPSAQPLELSRDALPPGTVMAGYEILSVLGERGAGILYLAMDHALQRRVVIREYLPAVLAYRTRGMAVSLRSEGHAEAFARGLESFVDETRLLARLDHPALVRVLQFWEANNTVYRAMPFYDGVGLDEARQSMAQPPDEAWLRDLLVPLLDALALLHGAQCYHWPISPKRILLQPDGRPVLLDHGGARDAGGDRVIPEPAFAAIEQYADATQLPVGPWTNLYALAAVAYYGIGGEAPVVSTARAVDDRMAPLFEVVDRLGRRFPDLSYSVGFVSTIERALRIRPQERPQCVADFRRALLDGRDEAPPSVVAPGAAEEARPDYVLPAFLFAQEETGGLPSAPPGAASGGSGEDMAWEPTLPGPPDVPPASDASDVPGPSAQMPQTPVDEFPRAGPHHAPDEREVPPPSWTEPKAGGRRLPLVASIAIVTVLALGAAGAMMWSFNVDDGVLRYMVEQGRAMAEPPPPPAPPQTPAADPGDAPVIALAEPPAPAVHEPPTPVAPEPPASQSTLAGPPPRPVADPGDAAASPAPTEAASDPVSLSDPPVASAPVAPSAMARDEAAEDPVPQTEPAAAPADEAADEAAEAPRPAPVVVAKKAPDNPRTLCGPRTPFSLYRCMKSACERRKYANHPECRYLRATDEVMPH
ncbi:serine/threonine protein kinase [Nitrogeniibacter mangrovi]|uniref:non-specific serine/threonine protein kinase n=1 Tax=Nitrogeniibacter mangrovi TaxID=2016596 RepID=A0A6C1BBF3_9RHOO|nr:serine/threonine protein kinase [Nitrogeniibacter mangrovi]QID19604.1 serine/threonine protein kinase [Nitrogeniibacter mangrovi]